MHAAVERSVEAPVWTVFAYFFPFDKLRLFFFHSDRESIEEKKKLLSI